MQTPLFATQHTPNLADYDVIAVSSSAGKDSQAMLDHVHYLARRAGVADRIIVVHADLGRVEWSGTGELAREQAEHYGAPFHVVSRIGGTAKKTSSLYEAGEEYGDLLDYAERRGAWPSPGQRWCTSEFKRGPILKFFTAVAREWRERTGETRACRILDCVGLRAEESENRAAKPAFEHRKATRTQIVDTWLPVHAWTEAMVWDAIHESGVPYHPAYDLGMPRLSYAFCIMASKRVLKLSGRHNRALLDEYVAVERRIGHTFKPKMALAEVAAELDAEAAAERSGCEGPIGNLDARG